MDTPTAFNAGIPAFGTWVLYAFLVAAAAAFGLAVAAASAGAGTAGRYLRAARLAALGTCALIALDVLLLAYAFVSHDFRVRYVMRYSDRTMPVRYLLASLWGGQDGSLLWWTLLLAGYTTACVLWLKNRYKELAPYVIAVLMTVVMFFGVLMAFAANPFSANVAGAPPNGEGLNPSLQNFYMAIHPPSLYTGFVGCTVPFAFVMAALMSGRLDEEWIRAMRKWALFAWVFLSIGNTLGMLWAYEELGWGGYWAWDPVENAACMPWFTCTAFLHSVMIQERRGSLKVWNVALVIATYVLTIFGTFLTRSGLIASIHAFAQSEIGVYFLVFLAVIISVSVALVAWRLPLLRKRTEIDSVLSREAMFVANNWVLLGICVFICLATTWPKVSEWLWRERLTVGPSFYNAWLSPAGMVLLALVGIGTLTPWRKATPALLWRAFRWPLATGAVASLAHVAFGARVGYPAVITVDPIYDSGVGHRLAWLDGHLPAVSIGLIAFNLVALAQEFWRGAEARVRVKGEGPVVALGRLVSKNRRRYGGYIAHVGIAVMFFGFTGSAWKTDGEASLRPGENFRVGRYQIRYDGIEMHRDANKREIYARTTVWRDGVEYVHARPGRFIFSSHPESPTSEVSITTSLRDDLYLVMASMNPETQAAHLKAYLNPFTLWIWLGGITLVLGAAVAMWPELSLEWLRVAAPVDPDGGPGGRSPGGGGGTSGGGGGSDNGGRGEAAGDPGGGAQPGAVGVARAGSVTRSAATTGGGAALLVTLLALGGALVLRPPPARAQGHTASSPPPVAGDSEAMSPEERRLYERMLCMCGDCQRLPLSTCTCDHAAATRAAMRRRLASGVPADQIVREYVARYGPAAVSVPPDAGHNRGVYLIPLAALAAGGALGVTVVRRWLRHVPRPAGAAGGALVPQPAAAGATNDGPAATRAEYDRQLDEELRGLDD